MRMQIDGIEDIISDIDMSVRGVTAVVDRMLTAGAEEAVTAQTNAIRRYEHILTGSMLDNTRYEPPKRSKFSSDARFVSVWSRGKDRKGTSNIVKAAVLNYSFTGWFDEAADEAEGRVLSAMREIWERQ